VVPVFGPHGRFEAVLSSSGGRLEFESVGFECVVEGDDLWHALARLREEHLEPRSLLLGCAGVRRDVYPSRMSRQMSGGRRAYRCRLGHPADASDLVDVLSVESDPSSLATCGEQLRFHNEWIEGFAALEVP